MRSSPRLQALLAVAALTLAACSPGAVAETATTHATTTLAATTPAPAAVATTVGPATTTTTLPPVPTTTTVAPGPIGRPYGSVRGLTMFRGNPSRTYYGEGPLPDTLEVAWRFPEAPMCGVSAVGNEPVRWCGTGWTGQPVVWERSDGVTEVIFGAYDKQLHFLDAATGERTRPDFPMGDIIKGSVSLDPDGYPLLYAGSRDSNYRIIALDRATPTELWRLSAFDVPGIWNNDWDSNAAVVDDVMYLGGENSWWYAVHLGRAFGSEGLVTIDPEIIFDMPAFTPELRALVGNQQSVESSTLVFEGVAYFANSAGRVVGVDVSGLPDGKADVVFDFWVGDDVDSTPIADEEGNIYIAAEIDHATDVGAALGQLIKLDPSRPDDPWVWGVAVPGVAGIDGGIWATPAIAGGVVYAPTNPGDLLAVDAADGTVIWRDEIGPHAWSSPVVIGDRLLVSVDCELGGVLRIYDITDPRSPVEISDNAVAGGCIESTPAVWGGRVYVGSRDGYFYALEGPVS